MKIRALLFVAAGALGFGCCTVSASAASIDAARMIKNGSQMSSVDNAHYRRCRTCRPYVPPYFYRGYPGPYDPYYYGPLYGYGPGYYGFYYRGDVRVRRRGHGRW
jgi:hypothetical protein